MEPQISSLAKVDTPDGISDGVFLFAMAQHPRALYTQREED